LSINTNITKKQIEFATAASDANCPNDWVIKKVNTLYVRKEPMFAICEEASLTNFNLEKKI
jgi:hypothetical protein